ncbi:MAG: 3-coathanger stack domain-containing protein, partial [Bacteroidota bacterium]
VTLGAQGEAVLRLGLGRDLSASRVPTISVNGNAITVPTDYRGDVQLEHDNFFGMLEIDVPYSDLVNGNNTISVTFPDAGGFVSSCALQLFDFSKAITRQNNTDRSAMVTWDNEAEFIPQGGSMAEFRVQDEVELTLTYSTAVVSGMEKDLDYVAVQLRELDENGMEVATSAFTTAVAGTADNAGTVNYLYTIPSNFATPNTDPIVPSSQLDAGHQYLLIIFSASDGTTTFVNDNTPVTILGAADRPRELTWDNAADFFDKTGTTQELYIGSDIDLELTYQTGISGGVTEDLNYIATQIKQFDENGMEVNASAFTTILDTNVPNSGMTTFTYTVPSTFADGTTAIPTTPNLPAGHTLRLLIFMSVDNDAAFADDNRDIILLDGRTRAVSWENEADYVPGGGTLAQFCPGETFPVTLCYSTGITGGVEEDLNYVAMQVRQVDASFGIVNTSAFQAVINGSAPNQDLTTFDYTLPTTFGDGSPIPATADLPAGHKLLLLIFMSIDSDSGFADDNTEIEILDAADAACTTIDDRARSISWENEADYVPNGGTLAQFCPGETFSTTLAYSTGITNGVEEDLNYVAMYVRQVDAAFNIIKDSDFFTVVNNSDPNQDTITFDYTLPTTFADGSMIPATADLPAGHKLLLLIFMSVDNDSGFANDNTEFELLSSSDAACMAVMDRARTINWENESNYFAAGGDLPFFEEGETFSTTLAYSTGVSGGVEEDLNYVAMQVRQIDAAFNIINTSTFQVVVDGSQPNVDTVTFNYTLPTTFNDGSSIPTSDMLPAGHRLLLLIFMSVDMDAGFVDDNTEIHIYSADCPTFITENMNLETATGYYQVSDFIETNNRILSPSEVVLDATNDITMKVGFEVQAGASFVARIEGCTASSVNQTVEERTEAVQEALSLYPNPTDGLLNISGLSLEADYGVQVFSASGKLIQNVSMRNNGSQLELETSALANGLYFIK